MRSPFLIFIVIIILFYTHDTLRFLDRIYLPRYLIDIYVSTLETSITDAWKAIWEGKNLWNHFSNMYSTELSYTYHGYIMANLYFTITFICEIDSQACST